MMDKSLLFIGEDDGYSALIYNEFKNIFKTVEIIPRKKYFKNISLLEKIESRVLFGKNTNDFNNDISNYINSNKPDIIFIVNGFSIYPKTIKKAAQDSKCFLFLSEYIKRDFYRYRNILNYTKYINTVFSFNPLNIPILENYGAKNIIRILFGFNKNIHFPPVLNKNEEKSLESDVLFIGQWSKDRENLVKRLIKDGINIQVYGHEWNKSNLPFRNEIKPLYGEDYTKKVACAKICLGLLYKANKDITTTRICEIPAIGSFLLAERTEENLRLYKDGLEAEFFSNFKELEDKIKYYLKNDDERKNIALAGKKRCMKYDYSFQARIKEMLQTIMNSFIE